MNWKATLAGEWAGGGGDGFLLLSCVEECWIEEKHVGAGTYIIICFLFFSSFEYNDHNDQYYVARWTIWSPLSTMSCNKLVRFVFVLVVGR